MAVFSILGSYFMCYMGLQKTSVFTFTELKILYYPAAAEYSSQSIY